MRLLRAPIADLTDRGYNPNGIIHVGLNDGEELPWYLHVLHVPVLGFEPVWSVFKELSENFHAAESAGTLWLQNVALADYDLEHERIRIPVRKSDGLLATKGASILPERYLSDEYSPGDYESVSVHRFDTWLRIVEQTYGIAGAELMKRYDTLAIDVQGMELQVLLGFGRWLDAIHCVQAECSREPMYEGEAPARDVETYLASRGFMRITPIVEHGDVCFVRP